MEFIVTKLEGHSHLSQLALLESPRDISGEFRFYKATVAVMKLCSQRTQHVQSQSQKQWGNVLIDFKHNIKNIRTMSPDYFLTPICRK